MAELTQEEIKLLEGYSQGARGFLQKLSADDASTLAAKKDASDNYAAHYAAKNPRSYALRGMLNAGTDLDAPNSDGQTVLFMVAAYGGSQRKFEAVSKAVKALDLNQRDIRQQTPLFFCALCEEPGWMNSWGYRSSAKDCLVMPKNYGVI